MLWFSAGEHIHACMYSQVEALDMERSMSKVQAWFKLRSGAFAKSCRLRVEAAEKRVRPNSSATGHGC